MQSAINTAQTLYDNSTTGTGAGDYPEGDYNTFGDAIQTAIAVLNAATPESTTTTPAEITNAVSALNTAVATFQAAIIRGTFAPDPDTFYYIYTADQTRWANQYLNNASTNSGTSQLHITGADCSNSTFLYKFIQESGYWLINPANTSLYLYDRGNSGNGMNVQTKTAIDNTSRFVFTWVKRENGIHYYSINSVNGNWVLFGADGNALKTTTAANHTAGKDPGASGVDATNSYLFAIKSQADMFEELQCPFTVTFDAGNGTSEKESVTEANRGDGITLPTLSPPSDYALTVYGWTETAPDNSNGTGWTSAPTLVTVDAQNIYTPTQNITLYAVFKAADNTYWYEATNFEIAANTTASYDDYAALDIIFNEGSQLEDASADPVHGVVKVVKTFATDKWYPIGFPFAVASVSITQGTTTTTGVIYNEDDDEELSTNPSNIGNATDDNFYVAKYKGEGSSNSNEFVFASTLAANTGYIVEFPSDPFNNGSTVTVTFTSAPSPSISSTASAEPTVNSGDYVLVANPHLTTVTQISNATAYYQYGYDDNGNYVGDNDHFGLVGGCLNTNYPLKPFGALVVYVGDTSNLRSSIGIGATETPVALPAVITKDPVVKTEYYNLQGQKYSISPKNGISAGTPYIVKEVHQSGKVTSKVISGK